MKKQVKIMQWIGWIIALCNSHGFSVSTPRSGMSMPDAVINFMHCQQPGYAANCLAVQITNRSTMVRSLHKAGSAEHTSLETVSTRIPVLLGRFADTTAMLFPASDYNKEFFTGPWPTGTMSEYFREVSYRQFELQGQAYGWFQADHSGDYYANHVYGIPDAGGRSPQFVREILALADQVIDFSIYDNDHDGLVESVIICHEGIGAENCTDVTMQPNLMWSHQSSLAKNPQFGGVFTTNDRTAKGTAVKINNYVLAPAASSLSGKMIEIGVLCHEVGHLLGLPDLYDPRNFSAGVGHWDLMASGNWNKPDQPAHLSAWSKMKLGWLIPTPIQNDSCGLSLPNAENNAETYRVWSCDDTANSEYFLLENRQALGFDCHLHGSGLLIWHIDESRTGNQDFQRKLVDLEEADGKDNLDHNINRGDPGDPFPGANGNARFDDTSYPNSSDSQGNPTGCAITNIAASDTQIMLDVRMGTTLSTSKLVIKDGEEDTGRTPTTCAAWWNNPDVYIDNDGDGRPDLPAFGMENLVWARVYNLGHVSACGRVRFYFTAMAALGVARESEITFIGEKEIAVSENGGMTMACQSWRIPDSLRQNGIGSLGAIVDGEGDQANGKMARDDNHRSQRNYLVVAKRPDQIPSVNGEWQLKIPFMIHNSLHAERRFTVKVAERAIPDGYTVVVNPRQTFLTHEEKEECQIKITVSRKPQAGDKLFLRIVLLDRDRDRVEDGLDVDFYIDDQAPSSPQDVKIIDRAWNTPPGKVAMEWQPGSVPDQVIEDRPIFYRIYHSKENSLLCCQLNLADSAAVDGEPQIRGFQREYAKADRGYFCITAIDAAGNESAPSDIVFCSKSTLIASDHEKMPVDFDLAQNFPNPFNDQTQICFLLPQAVRARVSILDLLGREIAILVDDHLQSGRHQINFSAQAFASGIYYYRLQTEDYSATKKMVLLR